MPVAAHGADGAAPRSYRQSGHKDRRERKNGISPKISESLFTFSPDVCIMCREQSRKPCVKCCQDGELCDRRRTFVRDRVSAPAAPYWTHPPLCSNDTRSGEWSAVILLSLPPRVIYVCVSLPSGSMPPGSFCVHGSGGQCVCFGSSPTY